MKYENLMLSGLFVVCLLVCTLVLGAVAEPAFAHLLEPAFDAAGVSPGVVQPVAFVIALTAATYLHMVFGEMVPKNVALADPVRAVPEPV